MLIHAPSETAGKRPPRDGAMLALMAIVAGVVVVTAVVMAIIVLVGRDRQ